MYVCTKEVLTKKDKYGMMVVTWSVSVMILLTTSTHVGRGKLNSVCSNSL